jgi:hypothetical protein
MRFIPQASQEGGDLRLPGIEPDPAVRTRLAERDRPDDGAPDLAEALDGAPDPGGRDRQLLAEFAPDQLGESELLGAEQRPPVLLGPVANRFGVAANPLLARHGQRHARAVRRGDAEALGGDLGLAVATVRHHHRLLQHPADRYLGLPAPELQAAGTGLRVRLHDAPGLVSEELRDLALQVGAEQRGNPGAAAVGLADRLQPQALPAFDDPSVGRTDI